MSGEDHGRFEELALGHVLGGLPEAEAAEFRDHLVACQHCRRRVAELRDIAADMARAERDEQGQASVTTARQVARRDETSSPPRSSAWSRSRRDWLRLGALVVGAVLVFALLLWNFHLRRVNAELLETTQRRETVLEVMATGTPLALRLDEGITGLASVDDDLFAISLVGVAEPPEDRALLLWFLEGDRPGEPLPLRAREDGRLAWAGEVGDATEVVLTSQPLPAREPGGRELARAEFD